MSIRVELECLSLQASLMLVSKTKAYLNEPLFRCSTPGKVPGLTHKRLTRLEGLARGKHSSLSRKSVDWGHEEFYNIEPRRG